MVFETERKFDLKELINFSSFNLSVFLLLFPEQIIIASIFEFPFLINLNVSKFKNEIEERLDDVLFPITVSIIGCVVNGPGEARSTDIGITGGGKGTHQIYVNGIPDHIIKNKSVADHVVSQVRKKINSLKINSS